MGVNQNLTLKELLGLLVIKAAARSAYFQPEVLLLTTEAVRYHSYRVYHQIKHGMVILFILQNGIGYRLT